MNSGTSPSRSNDAVLYTTSSATAKVPGSTKVQFSFPLNLFPGQNAVQNVAALFTFNGTVAKNTPAISFGSILFQTVASGSFSFLSLNPITLTGPGFRTHTFAAGSNLLSGTFFGLGVARFNGIASGGASNLSPPNDVTYTSDFLDFTPTTVRQFYVSLTSIDPGLTAVPGRALDSFRAHVSGSDTNYGFFSDGPPRVLYTVPEPGTFGLLILGAGIACVQSRRRAHTDVRSA